MKALRFLFLLSLAVTLGCEKEKYCENQECKDCLIAEADIDYGNPAADLCGWTARIENQNYSLNKDKENDFQHTGKVKIVYKKTNGFYLCGRGGTKIQIIEIIKIEKL